MIKSTILRNLKTLKTSVLQNFSMADLRYDGIVDDSVTVKNGNCLMNSVKIWLQTGEFDFHRNPDKGGWIEKSLVKKPLNSSTTSSAGASLKTSLEKEFPDITVLDVDVSYTLSPRCWYVKLSVMDKNTGVIGSDTITLDTDVTD